jgi:hypothetical protein
MSLAMNCAKNELIYSCLFRQNDSNNEEKNKREMSQDALKVMLKTEHN